MIQFDACYFRRLALLLAQILLQVAWAFDFAFSVGLLHFRKSTLGGERIGGTRLALQPVEPTLVEVVGNSPCHAGAHGGACAFLIQFDACYFRRLALRSLRRLILRRYLFRLGSILLLGRFAAALQFLGNGVAYLGSMRVAALLLQFFGAAVCQGGRRLLRHQRRLLRHQRRLLGRLLAVQPVHAAQRAHVLGLDGCQFGFLHRDQGTARLLAVLGAAIRERGFQRAVALLGQLTAAGLDHLQQGVLVGGTALRAPGQDRFQRDTGLLRQVGHHCVGAFHHGVRLCNGVYRRRRGRCCGLLRSRGCRRGSRRFLLGLGLTNVAQRRGCGLQSRQVGLVGVARIAHSCGEAGRAPGHYAGLHHGLHDGIGHLLEVVTDASVGVQANTAGNLVDGKLPRCGQDFSWHLLGEGAHHEAHDLIGWHALDGALDGCNLVAQAELLAQHFEGGESSSTLHSIANRLTSGAAVAVLLAKGLHAHSAQRNGSRATSGNTHGHGRDLLRDGVDRAFQVALQIGATLTDGLLEAAQAVCLTARPCCVFVGSNRVGYKLVDAVHRLGQAAYALGHAACNRVVETIGLGARCKAVRRLEVERGRLRSAVLLLHSIHFQPQRHAACGTFDGSPARECRIFSALGDEGGARLRTGIHRAVLLYRIEDAATSHVLAGVDDGVLAGAVARQLALPARCRLHLGARFRGRSIPCSIELRAHFWLDRGKTGVGRDLRLRHCPAGQHGCGSGCPVVDQVLDGATDFAGRVLGAREQAGLVVLGVGQKLGSQRSSLGASVRGNEVVEVRLLGFQLLLGRQLGILGLGHDVCPLGNLGQRHHLALRLLRGGCALSLADHASYHISGIPRNRLAVSVLPVLAPRRTVGVFVDVPLTGEVPDSQARRVGGVGVLGDVLQVAEAGSGVVFHVVDVFARLCHALERGRHDLHHAAGTVDAGCRGAASAGFLHEDGKRSGEDMLRTFLARQLAESFFCQITAAGLLGGLRLLRGIKKAGQGIARLVARTLLVAVVVVKETGEVLVGHEAPLR